MGGTDACSIDLSIATSNGSAYKLDARNSRISKETTLGGIGSSLTTKEGVLPDLGLAITGAKMEANGFNVQQAIQVKPSDHNSSEDAKRPDNALPCPRCNSLDTKFCYYNNYNVNQPRHFCKDCQRYWTAGGTLRNVAVGAGRRKRKYSSLESESCTEASSVDCCNPQDCLSTRNSFSNCKSKSPRKDPTGTCYRAGGLFQNIVCLPRIDSTSVVSDNQFSEKMQGNISSEAAWTKKRFASQHGLRPINSFDIRNQEKSSLEFTQLKLMTTLSGERIIPCGSVQHLHKLADNSKLFLTQNEELRDIGGELLLAIPSERQVSNESGCASSLTTQAMSEDACTYGGKSDVDSEISKEGDKRDIGWGLACERLRLPYHDSCKVSGGVHSASQGHVSALLTTGKSTMQFWKGKPENPEFEAAQTMQSVPQFWLSPVDRPGLPWSPPWLPTASAVNAAKAALITNAGVSKKPQPEPSIDMALKIGVLLQKESEKPQTKPTTPEQRVWVPKTSRLQDIDEATRSSIWSTLGIRDKQGPLVFGKTEDGFHCCG